MNALRVTTMALVLVAAYPVAGTFVYRDFFGSRPASNYSLPGRQPSTIEAAASASRATAIPREARRSVDFEAHYAEAPVSVSLDFGSSQRGRDTALLTPHASPDDAPAPQRGPPSLS